MHSRLRGNGGGPQPGITPPRAPAFAGMTTKKGREIGGGVGRSTLRQAQGERGWERKVVAGGFCVGHGYSAVTPPSMTTSAPVM